MNVYDHRSYENYLSCSENAVQPEKIHVCAGGSRTHDLCDTVSALPTELNGSWSVCGFVINS